MTTTYNVYQDGVLVANVPAPPTTITGLTNDVTYAFMVKPVVDGIEGSAIPPGVVSVTPHGASSRPFPAPDTSAHGVVMVPLTIDSTGSADVTASLNNWLANTVLDGSIVRFQPGGTYRMATQGIQLKGRHNLDFDLNGATILTQGPAASQLSSGFVLGHEYGGFWGSGGHDIRIRDGILTGNDPTPGLFTSGQEGHAAFEIDAATRVEITNVTTSAHPGDFVKQGDDTTQIWAHDNHVISCGRNGWSVISGTASRFDHNTFDKCGYYVWDLEPNLDTEAISGIKFLDNEIGSWGPDVGFGAGFGALGSGTAYLSIGDIEIARNHLSGVSNATLRTFVNQNQHRRLSLISITDNTSDQAKGAGGGIDIKSVDGLNIWGNLSAGVLVVPTLTSCTAVDTTP